MRNRALGSEDAGDVAAPLGAREPALPFRRSATAERPGERQVPVLGQLLGKLSRRVMAALQPAIRVGRDEREDVRDRRGDDLEHNRDGGRAQPPQRALLPRGDESANGIVVVN